jgi:hypothetical protein
MLEKDPNKRIKIGKALEHPFWCRLDPFFEEDEAIPEDPQTQIAFF